MAELPVEEAVVSCGSCCVGEEDSIFGSLDDLSLLTVFTFLSYAERIRVERVCRRWLNVARFAWKGNNSLVFGRRLDGSGKLFSGTAVRRCMSLAAPSLRKLSINAMSNLSGLFEPMMQAILSLSVNITAICIRSAEVSDENFATIGKTCPQLRLIHLGCCASVTDEGLRHLFLSCRSLREVHVPSLNFKGCKAFAVIPSEVEKLVLTDSRNLDRKVIVSVANRCRKLQHLDMTDCCQLNETFFNHAEQFSKSLLGLAITCDGNRREFSMKAVTQLKNLRKLRIEYSVYTTLSSSKLFCQIAASCRFLRSVIFCPTNSEVTDDVARSFALNCPDLEEVCFAHSYEISDEALFSLASGCPKLRRLVVQDCPWITDQGVLAFSGSRSLRLLNVVDCTRLTYDALLPFLDRMFLGTLKIIITDQLTEQLCFEKNPRSYVGAKTTRLTLPDGDYL